MPSEDPAVWQQRVALNMSLFQVMAVHGHLLLALRHPGAQAPGLTREAVEDTVAILSRMLVAYGGLTEAELRYVIGVEQPMGSFSWERFEAACARIDARVAAMGRQNPDAVGP
jgi:hypothetical protein